MTREQADNLAKLERIAEELQQVLNLFNLAGYSASVEEIFKIDQIAQTATSCQKLARM